MTTLIRKFSTALAASTMLLALPSCAQNKVMEPVASTKVPAAVVEMDGPALWKVADEDTTIYLFGTVHVLPKDVEWLGGSLDDAIASSDMLVTEIRSDNMDPATMQQAIMSRAVLPQGQTLRGLLSDEQRPIYETAMGKVGLPVAAFDQFEPWYGAMMLSLLPLLQQGYDPSSGVETVLTAQFAERPKGELETIDFQMDIFDTLPMDTQVNYLMEIAAGIDEVKPLLDRMVEEWAEGDAAELAAIMNESMTDPVLADRLLYSRNANWATWIDDRLDQPGTVFLAVGAGHLAGDKSVQDLLAERGIVTARVQ